MCSSTVVKSKPKRSFLYFIKSTALDSPTRRTSRTNASRFFDSLHPLRRPYTLDSMLQLLKNLASRCCGPARIDGDEEQQASALELSERATSGQPPSDQLLPLSTAFTPVGLQQAFTSPTPPAVAPSCVTPAVAELDAPSPFPCRPPSPPPSHVSPPPSLTASSPPAPPLLPLPGTFGRALASHSHTPAPPPSRATSTHLVSLTSSPETLHSPLFSSDTPLRRT